MSTARRLLAANSLLFLGTLVNRVSFLVFFSWLAHRLGEEGFGTFYLLVTITGMLAILANAGLDILVTRDVARSPGSAAWLYRLAASVKAILSVACMGGMVGYLLLTGADGALWSSGLVATLIVPLSTNMSLSEAVLRGSERFSAVAAVQALHGLLLAVVMLIQWTDPAGLDGLMAWLVGSYAIVAAASHVWLVPVMRGHADAPVEGGWRRLMHDAYPFALTSAIVVVFYRLDVLMLSELAGLSAVAWYGAAARLVENYGLIPGIAVSSIFPILSRQFVESREGLAESTQRALKFLGVVGLAVVAFSLVRAVDIIELFYGDRFGPSVLPFQVLCLRAGAFFLTTLLGHLLFTANQQRRYMQFTFGVVVLNVVLNLLLIPPLGVMGSALAMVVATIVLTWLHIRMVRRYVCEVRFAGNWHRAFMALAVAVLYWWWAPLHVLADAAVGTALYAAALFTVKAFSEDERQIILAAFRGGGAGTGPV